MPTSETIDLAHLDSAGFERLYAERIEPWLAQNEAARLAGIASFQRGLLAAFGAGAVVALGVFLFWRMWEPALIAFAMVALFGGAWAYSPLSKLQEQVKSRMLDTLAAAIGVAFQAKDFSAPAFQRMRTLNLVPSFDRSAFEDLFHGERQGCAFDLYEAHLQDERKDKDGDTTYVTVFRGQVVRIAFPKDFQGITIVRRDAGMFNALRSVGSEFKRVGLGDSRFEKTFEVYSNDQVEARYLVHPVFMERLLELETAFKGKSVRCAFEAGDLLLAVEGGNRFEIGSMFEPMATPDRAKRVVDDITQVLKLMDAVLTAETAPLLQQRLQDRPQ